MNLKEDESAEKEVTPIKRKTTAEKKLDLLSKCIEAITANAKPKATESSNPKISAFALYVDEKLSELNKRTRRIAEKRISDVLFDMEMSTDVLTDGEFSRPQRTQRNPHVGYNFFSVLYFTSIVIVYNSYTVQNNILIKIDGMVYSYIVEITNSYKYYIRNKLNLNY